MLRIYLCLDDDSNAVVVSNFKWKEHRQSLILFIWWDLFDLCYLFNLGLVLKLQFSFVIYIIFNCCYLTEAFIQKPLTNDDNRSNQYQQKSNNMQ